MVYSYMTLADHTEIVHTDVFEEDGVQKIEVHFERPTPNGFDTARSQLPSYTWLLREGFTDFLAFLCLEAIRSFWVNE